MGFAEREDLMDPLPPGMPRRERRRYYDFTYEGHVVDEAIHQDRVDWLLWSIATGAIDQTTASLDNVPLRALCLKKGAVKCAAHLEQLGWPLRREPK
jgi:hypothetical protein